MQGKQLDIFYNTTHLGGEELTRRRFETGRQNQEILAFFRSNPRGLFTPFDVQSCTGMINVPITSIRRAMHTLTSAGLLIKTHNKKEGNYGAFNHLWKLA